MCFEFRADDFASCWPFPWEHFEDAWSQAEKGKPFKQLNESHVRWIVLD